jgi:hypothetical protein
VPQHTDVCLYGASCHVVDNSIRYHREHKQQDGFTVWPTELDTAQVQFWISDAFSGHELPHLGPNDSDDAKNTTTLPNVRDNQGLLWRSDICYHCNSLLLLPDFLQSSQANGHASDRHQRLRMFELNERLFRVRYYIHSVLLSTHAADHLPQLHYADVVIGGDAGNYGGLRND